MNDPMRLARSRLEVAALAACAACFALFSANVLFGWSAGAMGWDASWRLERVPEFLLLFASAISFAVASLAAERRNQAAREQAPPAG
jgi:TRAP-type C4-dicarboxylate transport system permease small subunit